MTFRLPLALLAAAALLTGCEGGSAPLAHAPGIPGQTQAARLVSSGATGLVSSGATGVVSVGAAGVAGTAIGSTDLSPAMAAGIACP